MSEEFEGIRRAAESSSAWQHWIPFAALSVKNAVPQNRPMATRLIEQMFVALIAGGSGTYATFNALVQKQEVTQAAQAEQIKALQNQVEKTEQRLTAQIMELRARQLK